jgi:hypothetical protein
MRDGTENDGAGRGTETVDDHNLAGVAHTLKFTDVGFDPPATVLGNPNLRAACCNSSKQENRRE